MWLLFACLSAFFAGITAILSKCGAKNVNLNVATAIRTSVVLLLSWIVVFITGEIRQIGEASLKSLVFLLISGVFTGCKLHGGFYLSQFNNR